MNFTETPLSSDRLALISSVCVSFDRIPGVRVAAHIDFTDLPTRITPTMNASEARDVAQALHDLATLIEGLSGADGMHVGQEENGAIIGVPAGLVAHIIKRERVRTEPLAVLSRAAGVRRNGSGPLPEQDRKARKARRK